MDRNRALDRDRAATGTLLLLCIVVALLLNGWPSTVAAVAAAIAALTGVLREIRVRRAIH